MKKDEYLNRVKTQLKGLSEEKQIELINEISHHLDETLADPAISGNSIIDHEMGNPEELGRRLHRIHHQRRWVDFLLVLIPTWLIAPLSNLIIYLLFHEKMSSQLNNSMAIKFTHYLYIIFCFTLMIIALRRYKLFSAPQLAVYWMVQTWWGIVTLNLSYDRWNLSRLPILETMTIIETIIWATMLLILGYALIRLLFHSQDLSVVILSLIPFTIATANLVIRQYITTGYFPVGYNLPSMNTGFIGTNHIVFIIWAALFFISKNRTLRWAGLLIRAAYISLLNGVVVYHYPGFLALWSLPTLVVISGFIIDYFSLFNFNNLLYTNKN